MIAVDLSKQQTLDADPKAIQQIKFTGNLNRGQNVNENSTMLFIIEEVEETVLNFSEGTVKLLWFHFVLIQYQFKMTQYNTLNVKLSNSQLNKLKSEINNGTEATLKLSSNSVADTNDENNFTQKLVLTNTQFSKLCKTFANNS